MTATIKVWLKKSLNAGCFAGDICGVGVPFQVTGQPNSQEGMMFNNF